MSEKKADQKGRVTGKKGTAGAVKKTVVKKKISKAAPAPEVSSTDQTLKPLQPPGTNGPESRSGPSLI